MNPKWKLRKACAGRPQEPGRRTRNPDKDPDHLDWIRSQPCALITFQLPGATKCYGETHAHHETGAGLAVKAPDRRTMPLCRVHHSELHGLIGTFRGWAKARAKRWQKLLADIYEKRGDERRRKVAVNG